MVQRRAAHFVVRKYNRIASVGVSLHQLGWNSLQRRRKAMRLHHGLVAANGMPQLIPIRRASRHLNSNAYEVPKFRNKLSQVLVFPTHNKGMELVTRRYCHPVELGLFQKSTSFMIASVCVFYLSIYIYLFTCLSICNLHIVSQFIYLLLTTALKNLHF